MLKKLWVGRRKTTHCGPQCVVQTIKCSGVGTGLGDVSLSNQFLKRSLVMPSALSAFAVFDQHLGRRPDPASAGRLAQVEQIA